MIQIEDKVKCCGCGACVQRCPKNCILLEEDGEGFLYPVVDKDSCVDCGLCEKVCPVLNQGEKQKPLHVYAAKNEDEEIRRKSSSGGIFTLLAAQVIKNGGVVFGARFNENWEVVHDYTETEEGLSAFRGSKYVQSKIGETYKQVEGFLREGREVMFSGTPCQVAGLRCFLGKDCEKLFTVECFCHGVPSPMIWREYLKCRIEKDGLKLQDVDSISFRDKTKGWDRYKFSIVYKNQRKSGEFSGKNEFMCGFLGHLYLRPVCHACIAKQLKSGADFSLGDFWGIQNTYPQLYDKKGVSALFVNTEKAEVLLQDVCVELNSVDYNDVIKYNMSYIQSASMNEKRKMFWDNYGLESLSLLCRSLTRKSFRERLEYVFKRFFLI